MAGSNGEMEGLDGPDAVGSLIRVVPEGRETVLKVARELVGEGDGAKPETTFRVERRVLQPEPPNDPKRQESPRRVHTFFDPVGFAAYLNRYGGKNTVVVADPKAGMVQAVLDEKALDGFEVLSLAPMIHPLLAPWVDLVKGDGAADDDTKDEPTGEPRGRLPLQEFVAFLARNRRIVVRPEGKALALTLSQVRCSTSVTLQRGRGTRSVNGLKVASVIQGEKSGEELVDLPDEIVTLAPLFVGRLAREIAWDLTLLPVAAGTEIIAELSSADLAAALVEEFEQIVEAIDNKDWTVGLGRVRHAPWAYL